MAHHTLKSRQYQQNYWPTELARFLDDVATYDRYDPPGYSRYNFRSNRRTYKPLCIQKRQYAANLNLQPTIRNTTTTTTSTMASKQNIDLIPNLMSKGTSTLGKSTIKTKTKTASTKIDCIKSNK